MCIVPITENMNEHKLESKRIININSELPQHILQVIFAKLPIVNLPVCRLVCKAWNDLVLDYASSTTKVVSNTFFIGIEHNQYFPPYMGTGGRYLTLHCIDFDKKHLEGMSFVASFGFDRNWTSNASIANSCNGLLCIITQADRKRTTNACILNPMTNEYIQLPTDYDSNRKYCFSYWGDTYHYGLGFSPKTKQYKIVRVRYEIGSLSSLVEVIRFGRGSKWSIVQYVPFIIEKHGVYFNGAIYWVGEEKYSRKVICRLKVEDEKFEAIYHPEVCPDSNMAIGTFNGCLYLTFCKQQYHKFEAWRMQSYGGEDWEDSWIREFIIDGIPENWAFRSRVQAHLKLIKFCGDGEILCLVYGLYFFLYNPKTGKIKALNQTDRTKRTLWVFQIESMNFGSLREVLAGDG